MFSKGLPSELEKAIYEKANDFAILKKYIGITKIPYKMKSPFREDKHPSFSFYSKDGEHILFRDFATGEHGNTFAFLSKLWNIKYFETLLKVYNEIPSITGEVNIHTSSCKKTAKVSRTSDVQLQCKIRNWKQYDIDYWAQFGISYPWLKYADVYPISHKIVISNGRKYVFKAEKYAYAFIEKKEGKVTMKIYQPFSSKFKWQNKHDSSVISLWTKVPKYGKEICICSSVKDALCLWANMNIPSIAIQGEGYHISDTAANELRKRYDKIYILLDNDEAGLKNGKRLSEETGFENKVLPPFEDGKDISDFMKIKGKEEFLKTMNNIFNVKN